MYNQASSLKVHVYFDAHRQIFRQAPVNDIPLDYPAPSNLRLACQSIVDINQHDLRNVSHITARSSLQFWDSAVSTSAWCANVYQYLLGYQYRPTTYCVTHHCSDVIIRAMESQITSLTSVYSIVYSGADQRKHQSSVSLAFVRGIHQWPVNSPHKGPVTRKMFSFDDVIILGWHLSSALWYKMSHGHVLDGASAIIIILHWVHRV